MNNTHPITERFVMYNNKEVECYDDNNLFIKGGITVIGSLAGEGKTTYIINQSKQWKAKGYSIFHFNFDNAPTYNAEMLEPPVSSKDFTDFYNLLETTTCAMDIVVIDSLKAMVSFVGVDIENNKDTYPIMTNLRRISKKTGVSFILIHHVYKAKNVKTIPSSFYGSRAIEEQCDSGFIFEKDEARIVKNRAGHQRDKLIALNLPSVIK